MPERILHLPPCRFSKATWTQSRRSSSRCPYPNKEVGPDGLQRSLLPSPTSLWFWHLFVVTYYPYLPIFQSIFYSTPSRKHQAIGAKINNPNSYFWSAPMCKWQSTDVQKGRQTFSILLSVVFQSIAQSKISSQGNASSRIHCLCYQFPIIAITGQ